MTIQSNSVFYSVGTISLNGKRYAVEIDGTENKGRDFSNEQLLIIQQLFTDAMNSGVFSQTAGSSQNLSGLELTRQALSSDKETFSARLGVGSSSSSRVIQSQDVEAIFRAINNPTVGHIRVLPASQVPAAVLTGVPTAKERLEQLVSVVESFGAAPSAQI